MSRLEKKCFVGSAALHGLLLVVFVLGAAYVASKPPDSAASVITILPQDTKAFGKADGNPDPPAPASSKLEPERPRPLPSKPVEPDVKPEPLKPKEPEVKKAPEPVKDRSELPVAKQAKKPEIVPKSAMAKPQLPTKTVRRTNEAERIRIAKAQEADDRKYREEVAKWNERRDKALSAANEAGGIGKSLSKSTVVTSFGEDISGGRVSGGYGESLKAIYDAHWKLGSDLSDDESVACVSVVVLRDGTVKSAKITKASGNAAFDRSVKNVLNDVRTVKPFPSEMKDSEREFTWRFERKLRAG